jgi:signal transduction histidine kinase
MGRLQVLFVIPYTIPLVAASILLYGVFHGTAPNGAEALIFPALIAMCFAVGVFWGGSKGKVPRQLGMTFSAVLGLLVVWVCLARGPEQGLNLAEVVNLQMAVVLVIYVFRRVSPGVVLSVLGFTAWSLLAVEIFPTAFRHPELNLHLMQVIVMGKVVAAIGMILLALEDELDVNKAAQERERRARKELEAYTRLILSRRRTEDFDRQGDEICETVARNSRFSQAALLLEQGGRYRLAGSAGLNAATAKALGELAARISSTDFLLPSASPPAIENSVTCRLDLTPWLAPGDDLERVKFTRALAVPMSGRSGLEGALLLAGMRTAAAGPWDESRDELRAEDLLGIEMLAARMQATRSQTMTLEKLIDAEKFAGLGQLAGIVTQQMNNPLTVILGYASLLEDAELDEPARKGVESILTEARRMRSTLESLSRIARPHGDQLTAVSIAELLADMEQLHRSEFLQRSIEFQLNVAPGLPRARCSAQQLRQAVLHCLQFAMTSVERRGTGRANEGPKAIRLEASSEGNLVQILVAHSGPGFLHPERAFDPFVPAHPGEDTAGLGLSLCASILRDNSGRAAAVNMEPRGAAIILELQAA